MDELFGEFGHTGPFDLTRRPVPNASLPVSAVPIIGKKALFVKLRVPVETGLLSMSFCGPWHGFSGPDTRVLKECLRPER